MAVIFCAWFFDLPGIEKHGQKTGCFLRSGFVDAAVYWNQPEQDASGVLRISKKERERKRRNGKTLQKKHFQLCAR